MATLALPPPAHVWRHDDSGPTYGTGAVKRGAQELHGQDLSAVFENVRRMHRENAKLAARLLSQDHEEDFPYEPVPPLRSYYIDVIYVAGGKIEPMKFDFGVEDDDD